jgi:hypothetical protein
MARAACQTPVTTTATAREIPGQSRGKRRRPSQDFFVEPQASVGSISRTHQSQVSQHGLAMIFFVSAISNTRRSTR